MLLQRIRSAEPTVEAAIAYNLVDLALAAPESSFLDIIRALSSINRSANPDDPRFSNNMVAIRLPYHPELRLKRGNRSSPPKPALQTSYIVDLNSTKRISPNY